MTYELFIAVMTVDFIIIFLFPIHIQLECEFSPNLSVEGWNYLLSAICQPTRLYYISEIICLQHKLTGVQQ